MTETATATVPTCPKCSGPMWDQKAGKFPYKPGTPIFKCRDKECATNGGVIWEPKNANGKPPVTRPASAGASAPNEELPELLRDTEAEEKAELAAKLAPAKLTGNGLHRASARPLGPLYNECLEFAKQAMAHHFGNDVATADIVAATATLFIQAARDGHPIRAAKVAPPPPPPKPAPDSFPTALIDKDDDLPF